MEVIHTPDFEKGLKVLPKRTKDFCIAQEKRFKENFRDSRLHMKKLQGLDSVFSFRINREYRVLFYFSAENIAVFFAVGHRKDIYR
jgi:mRNA-degrading endonuclease RelE of RelBE toxin-antitoxin system